jgi:hypothetical protein
MASIRYALDELGAQLEVIEFDATVQESYSDSSTITTHPVELGQSISDYAKPELTRLTLVGTITNTPIQSTTTYEYNKAFKPLVGTNGTMRFQARSRVMTNGATYAGGGGTPIQPPGFKIDPAPVTIQKAQYTDTVKAFAETTLQFPGGFDRCFATYSKLVELQQKAVPVSVYATLRYYYDMLISSVSVTRTEAEDSIDITIEFTRFVQAETSSVLVRRPEKKPEADRNKDPIPPVNQAPAQGGYQNPEYNPGGESFLYTFKRNLTPAKAEELAEGARIP